MAIATDGAGIDARATAGVGPGSTSEVRTQIGDARYQVVGAPTAIASATTTPVLPG